MLVKSIFSFLYNIFNSTDDNLHGLIFTEYVV